MAPSFPANTTDMKKHERASTALRRFFTDFARVCENLGGKAKKLGFIPDIENPASVQAMLADICVEKCGHKK